MQVAEPPVLVVWQNGRLLDDLVRPRFVRGWLSVQVPVQQDAVRVSQCASGGVP